MIPKKFVSIYLLKLPSTQFPWDFPQSSDGLLNVDMVLYCFLLGQLLHFL